MPIGIDLSKWNIVNDYANVAKQVDFVILRTGYAQTKDESFDKFASSFQSLGVKVLGVYHFSYALTKADAINEAEFAVRILEKAGLPKTTLVFFDYEYDSVTYSKKNGILPTKKTVTELTKAFCDKVSSLGYKVGVYLNVDFYNNWYEKGFLENYPLWIADWRHGYVHDEALIHQYSCRGSINGIIGYVDVNRYYPNNAAEQPEPDIYDPITELAKEVIAGKWGNGEERKAKLLSAIQSKVNELLKS